MSSANYRGVVLLAQCKAPNRPMSYQWIYVSEKPLEYPATEILGISLNPDTCMIGATEREEAPISSIRLDEYSPVDIFSQHFESRLASASPKHMGKLDVLCMATLIWSAGEEWLGWERSEGVALIPDIVEQATQTYYHNAHMTLRKGFQARPDALKHVCLAKRRIWSPSTGRVPSEGWNLVCNLVDQLLRDSRPVRSMPTNLPTPIVRITKNRDSYLELKWGGILKTIQVPYTTMTSADIETLDQVVLDIVRVWTQTAAIDSMVDYGP